MLLLNLKPISMNNDAVQVQGSLKYTGFYIPHIMYSVRSSEEMMGYMLHKIVSGEYK